MPRSARTLATIAAACGALAIGACGGSGDEASSPLDSALGYLPEDAPFVVAFETDPDGEQVQAARAVLDRFPSAARSRSSSISSAAATSTSSATSCRCSATSSSSAA